MIRFFYGVWILCLVIHLASCGGSGMVIVDAEQQDSAVVAIASGTAVFPCSPDGTAVIPPAGSADRLRTNRGVSTLAGPRFPTRAESIDAGLDYLLTVRGSFPIGGVTYDNIWEWVVGDGVSNYNQPGVAASCFLRAARASTDASTYRTEALKTVDDYIVTAYDPDNPAGSLSTARPYAHDVYALYLAWEDTGNTDYLDLAHDLAGRTMSDFTGATYADRMIDNRLSLAGWDAAPYIYGFYLVGAAKADTAMTAWATAMADQMLARWDDWDGVLAASGNFAWDWTALSYGGMLKALAIVPDANSAGYAGKITAMRDWLLDNQDPVEGWWPLIYSGVPYDDGQATAFALEGLNYDGTAATEHARVLGEQYLRSEDIQLASGQLLGYFDDPATVVYTESVFEGLMALASQTVPEPDVNEPGQTVWTVDDNRVECPDADFLHPQDAVNAANAGDTILVYPGTYGSRVAPDIKPPHWGDNDRYAPALIVYKDNLTITAYDNTDGATVIESTHIFWSNPVAVQWSTGGVWDGSQYVRAGVYPSGGTAPNAVAVIASGVTIEGFTLHRHFEGTYATKNTAGVMIGGLYAGDPGHLGSDGNTVRDCHFSDVWHAVYIWHSSGNNISDNDVAALTSDHWAAISIYDGYNDTQIGYGYTSKDNLIVSNVIANKGISVGAWEPPTWADNGGTVVVGNTCTNIGTHYSNGRKLFSHNATTGGTQLNPGWSAATAGIVGVDGVSYDGDTDLVYGDTIGLHATLDFKALQAPADGSGFDVTFTIDGSEYYATTDENGACGANVPQLDPGVYPISVSAKIWDSYFYTDSATLTIVPEATGITYTGLLEWAVPSGSTEAEVTLQGTISWLPAGSSGAGFEVSFAVDGNAAGSGTTDAAGIGQHVEALSLGTYDVTCSIGEFSDTAFLVVYDPNAYANVTGGGWIDGVYDSKAHFAFNAQLQNGEVVGTFKYSDGTEVFDEVPVTWLLILSNTEASFGGTGWNVYVEDNGQPGKDSDYIKVKHTSTGYEHDGLLGGGNIKIH